MTSFKYIFIILTITHVINTEEDCKTIPPDAEKNPFACCHIPKLIASNDYIACGMKGISGVYYEEPQNISNCTQQVCLFNKLNLMENEIKVNTGAAIDYLNLWASRNPLFKNAVAESIKHCLISSTKYLNCEPTELQLCILHQFFVNCPNWEKNNKCQKLRELVDRCSETHKM